MKTKADYRLRQEVNKGIEVGEPRHDYIVYYGTFFSWLRIDANIFYFHWGITEFCLQTV